MSYTKQTWQAGDEITSAKLNHLEDGINNIATEVANFPVDIDNPQDGDTLIYNAAEQKWVSGSSNGGGIFIVRYDNDANHLDKTAGEIIAACDAGKIVYLRYEYVHDDGTSNRSLHIFQSYNYSIYTDGNESIYLNFEGNYLRADALTDYPIYNE